MYTPTMATQNNPASTVCKVMKLARKSRINLAHWITDTIRHLFDNGPLNNDTIMSDTAQ
jgi:hypothetical protein